MCVIWHLTVINEFSVTIVNKIKLLKPVNKIKISQAHFVLPFPFYSQQTVAKKCKPKNKLHVAFKELTVITNHNNSVAWAWALQGISHSPASIHWCKLKYSTASVNKKHPPWVQDKKKQWPYQFLIFQLFSTQPQGHCGNLGRQEKYKNITLNDPSTK